jgi:VWFA-related protein
MMKWRFPPDPLCYSLRGLGERQSLIDKWAVKMASGVAKACFYALIAALAFRAASTIIGAQDDRPNGGSTDSQKPLVLRKTVRMVQVPVVVKDSSGSLILDLTERDFAVFEDDTRRPLTYFINELQPLSVVVVVDRTLPQERVTEIASRARALANTFTSSDQEALYGFDEKIELIQDFTANAELIADAAAALKQSGRNPVLSVGSTEFKRGRVATLNLEFPFGKRLRDAMYAAGEKLTNHPDQSKHSILVISNGIDGSGNRFSWNEIERTLHLGNTSI